MRPICINPGCGKPAMVSHAKATGDLRYRVHCGHCQKASYGGHPHAPGVTPFKTGQCSNTNGHLGFDCLIKWPEVPAWAKGMTEIDHKDGDPHNNVLENVEELCPICHKLKGQRNGDYDGHKRRRTQTIS
jgi:hypothetical protein